MTGQDFQDKLDALVSDMLAAPGGDLAANIALRNTDNTVANFTLTRIGGVITASEKIAVQNYINGLKPVVDTYETERAPVTAALETFNTERAGHQGLIDAASAARTALSDALLADAGYQAAQTALEAARADAGYIAAVEAYRVNNVSENFGNLGDAKGKYIDL